MLEPAQLSDLDAINALVKQADELHAAWRPDLFSGGDNGFSADILLEMQKNKELFVVRAGGKTIAFTRVRIQAIGRMDEVPVKKVMFLEELCVDEAARHQGIGQRIVDDLKVMAKEAGCTSVCLTVYPENENARALYEKTGFSVSSINMRCKI